MKRRYLQIVRRAYRYLRHPRIRQRPWLMALTKPLFERELWRPCAYSVAGGLSIGLFCAMLPIPFQMIIAALASVRAKANIPVAMAACWVTNPFTQVAIWLSQERLGDWIRTKSDAPVLHILAIEKTVYGVTLNIASFTVGFLVMGIILGVMAYPIVYGVSAFLPKATSSRKPAQKSSH